jgi:hypothetical protein
MEKARSDPRLFRFPITLHRSKRTIRFWRIHAQDVFSRDATMQLAVHPWNSFLVLMKSKRRSGDEHSIHSEARCAALTAICVGVTVCVLAKGWGV